ncbi:hypothetical protein [Aquimarina pacifica]|uniref:hypothetical protein n=1 Tax=Aquimarina pacifica TaxID=1296415 RepID=UPI00046F5AA3|nr:hypothetical protein [Aquimarina pacifica]
MDVNRDVKYLPNFKLSKQHDLILFLIKNELLGIRFINELRTVGFDTSSYPIELSAVILGFMGFTKQTDQLCEWYYITSSTYAKQFDLKDDNMIREAVFDFYMALHHKLRQEQ